MSLYTKKCEMFSIKELLTQGHYIIPMYQRNYAWEEAHLIQLIQDIWDCHDSQRNYYIGTLVVHEREDGSFETVDGQQRLTTLNIILCALRNEIDTGTFDLSWYKGVNITYEYRGRSTQTLTALYNHSNDEKLDDVAISNMYNNVRRTIERIVPKEQYDVFLDYFLDGEKDGGKNGVQVTRVVLPVDTDLNHYFEIMNSRGEQLEKHEILKALIMRSSSEDIQKSWLVGQIWEACADMDRYVPLNFTPGIRDKIFGPNWDQFDWESLDDMAVEIKGIQKAVKNEQFSIMDVLNRGAMPTVNEQEKEGDRFESVLKFPGFLLQVLRVYTKEDIPLDDKRLLLTFDKYIKEEGFADAFILKMLELRFLYDKYVIKRDYKDETLNGKMNLLTLTRQKESFSYNKTFTDGGTNRQVIVLESMFHVSLPSQNYKHWLCAVLSYVNENKDGKGLAKYLEKLAKTYMFGRFLQDKSYNDNFYYNVVFNPDRITLRLPEKITFPSFTDHIDFFIFNYIDYCLWRNYRDKYYDFEFTSRSSVEHFYPQHPMTGPEMDKQYLDDIGNLCLISGSKNSELSNYSPLAKTEHYGKNGYDSLKQKVMMDVVNDNKKSTTDTQKIWWTSEVEKHHQLIEELVRSSFDSLE